MQTLYCRRDLGIPYRAGRRTAVTLIELLIVMGILTILATLSLTTVKGLLRDQKVTQAARLVEQYIESARVRALTNQRPVAVFLERGALQGVNNNNGADPPVAGNYTVTRLTIGEVFPPYAGDVLDVTGALTDFDTNGFADRVTFQLDDVVAGFGQGGFIQRGDTIEFAGFEGRFPITDINLPNANPPTVVVQFANPPLVPGTLLGMVPPAMPVTSSGLNVGFRVYRRPTKSLVGAIALPRGTCVDLAASGFGPSSAGAADDAAPFGLASAPVDQSNTLSPRDYSRIAIIFSGDGRLSGCYAETKLPRAGTHTFLELLPSQILYLMVGRTEQVLPLTNLNSLANRRLSLRQRSPQSDADQVISNLMDPANVWVMCNPFTGEVKSAPVSQVPENVQAAGDIFNVVRASRALARSGMRDQL